MFHSRHSCPRNAERKLRRRVAILGTSLASVCLLLTMEGCQGTGRRDRASAPAGKGRARGRHTTRKGLPQEQTRYVMGTLAKIVVYDPGRAELAATFEAGFRALEKVDRLMSTYKPESEISRINREPAGDFVPASPETLGVLQRSIYWSQRTQGAFDVTVGPLVALWRKAAESQQLPTAEELKEARSKVGYRNIQINGAQRGARLAVPGMKIDLGGVAKGYGVDLAYRAMKRIGVASAVINCGGDLFSFGEVAPGKFPVVHIQHPVKKGKVIGSFSAKNTAVATSGNYERFLEIQGKRYGHILDPRTGQPASGVVSATVLATSAADADALATALFVLGPQVGRALIEKQPAMEALILSLEPGDSKKLHVTITRGLQKIMQWQSRPRSARR